MGFIDSIIESGAKIFLSDRQNNQQQEAVDKANEYNKPINQMARLKEAGLNPNLIYGSVTNTPAQYVDYGRANDIRLESPLKDISEYQDIKNKDAQNQVLRNQALLTQQNAQESKARENLLDIQMQKLYRDIDGTILDNESKAYELGLAKSSGMSIRDPFYARFTGRSLNWLKDLYKHFTEVDGYDTVDGKVINRNRR